MIGDNSTWEGAFYQIEWIKINWSWFFFSKIVTLNVSELFCVTLQANNEHVYAKRNFHFKLPILYACKFPNLIWWRSVKDVRRWVFPKQLVKLTQFLCEIYFHIRAFSFNFAELLTVN